MITLTKFSTPWCAPCKKYDPILDRIESDRTDVKVERVDVEQEPEKAAKFNISGVPFTVLTSEDGTVLGTYQGVLNLSALNKILDAMSAK